MRFHPQGLASEARDITTHVARKGLRTLLPMLLGGLWIALFSSGPARALELVLTTDNDYLTSNRTDDDLYTFSFDLEARFGDYAVVFRENAFTDRESGQRFDETYLLLGGRALERHRDHWSLRWQGGLAHVGRGILGEPAQNLIHRLIGNKEVDLDYIETSNLYPHLVFEAIRPMRRSSRLAMGPHLEVDSTPGFKSQVFAGWLTTWNAARSFYGIRGIRATVGAKLASSSQDVLREHLRSVGPAADVELDMAGGMVMSWSYNRYGTAMQHVSFGYRIHSEPSLKGKRGEKRR